MGPEQLSFEELRLNISVIETPTNMILFAFQFKVRKVFILFYLKKKKT